MRRRLWTLLAVLACVSGEYLMGGHLDNNAGTKSRSGKTESPLTSGRETHTSDLDLDLVAEESTVAAVVAAGTPAKTSTDDDGDAPRYRIPYPFAFNGGEPFSLEKDPITGKIDFAKAPPVRALNAGRYREREDEEGDSEDGREDEGTYSEREGTKGNVDVSPNEINTYTPNFHDFLNLPVHYSSDKYGNDEYPLISNSYANTKVQSGTNSYSTYNHKPYHPESDLYVRPTKVSYASMMKTSTHKTTSVNDLKAKWTNSASTSTIMTSVPVTTTNSSRIALSTSTRAPVVTTWKPPSPPISFHSIDRTVMQMENETNLLPIEKLHASGHVESHRNPGNVPTRSPNAGATERTQIVNRYKEQSNFNNFVLPHARPEAKPAQNEGYKDIYDIFKLPDGDGEDEDERESDSDGDSDDEAENDESDYFLPFKELLKKDVTSTSTPSTTTSAATSPTTDTTTVTTTTVTASSTETTTTIATTPWRSSSVPPARQEDALASDTLQLPTMPQRPFVPSSPNNDRKQSITEHHDVIINHGYRPSPMIKSEPDRTGIVIESTSNIVIPPDQDTVSFVLGNRQNVDGGYYTIGTALGENIYDSSPDMDTPPFWSIRNEPHVPVKEVKHHEHHSSASVTESNPERVTYKWWSPTSSALKGSNELEPARPQTPLNVAASIAHDTKNQSDQRDPPGYVTFPNDETRNKDATTEEHVVVVNEADSSVRESPIKTTLATMTTIATNATKLHFPTVGGDLPQLAEDLLPPAESSRPPSYYYQYQFDTPRPDHQRPQRLPLPPRIKPYSGPHPGPHSVPPSDVGMRKRPYSPDTKLPNILPQFRPNAKASHGHRGQDVIGTMPAGQGLHTRIRQPNHPPSRRPPPPPPPLSYLQRLNPPPPPIHAVRLALVPTSKADVVALPHETEPTIRRFRPPHSGGPSISRGNSENAPSSNRLLAHGIGQEMANSGVEGGGENRKEDNRIKSEIAGERENESSERYLEEPPMMPPRPPLFPKRRTADPPRVTTLQMIQHHGEFGDENEDDGNDDEAELVRPARPLLVHEAERRKLDEHETTGAGEQPVYVVYPVNTAVNIHPDDNDSEKDGSVVVGTRGPQRPLPPDTLLQNERDETHTVYNGRPVALDFPYPLERPDPSSVFPAAGVKETPVLVPSEQRQQQQQQQQQASAATDERENGKIEQDAVNVIPYLQDFLPYRKKNDAAISVTLHRTAPFATTSASTLVSAASTPISTPIAYVYTPTHATYPDRRFDDIDDNDDDKDADAVASVDAKQTVLLPSQQPSSSSSSAPEPQSFMAPFIASMSAETSNKNGWSVIVVDPPAVAERKSDSDDNETKFDEVDTQTERNDFDADNFKPQLFGGFQPLYEFPIEDTEHQNDTSTEMDMARHSKELPSVPDRG